MRPTFLLLLLAICVPTHGASAAAGTPSASTTARARALFDEARALLARSDIDSRRAAIERLDQVVLLTPGDADAWVALGNATLEGDFRTRARQCFESAERAAPERWEGAFGIGRIASRDWKSTMDPKSLDDAIEAFARAARLGPEHPEPWLRLAPLLYENGDLEGALGAIERIPEAEPHDPRADLMLAYLAYRAGDVEFADSVFAVAIPKMPREVRQRFDDLAPLITEHDTGEFEELQGPEQVDYRATFWRQSDPDPTTAANEARLEYWSRVAHALCIMQDPETWDMRTELYARFGAPGAAQYRPPATIESIDLNRYPKYIRTGMHGIRRIGEAHRYPMRVSVWEYPTLGMRVFIQDRTLSEHYRLPIAMGGSAEPVPSPAAMANEDLLAVGNGRAFFPVLPPGVRKMPVAGHVARFETPSGVRLLAHVETEGSPSDTVSAECVVLDTLGREVRRGSRQFSPSACRPERERTADFAFEVPPGRYRVVASVRDARDGRGLYRTEAHVADSTDALEISDVLVVCGPIDPVREARELRLLPNPRAIVEAGDPLVAYFEVYHLKRARDGRARFEYEYRVYSEADPRRRPWYQRLFGSGSATGVRVRSQDEVADTQRRQFAVVPVQSLPPGPYRIEIRVRDLVGGATRVGVARFERTASRPS